MEDSYRVFDERFDNLLDMIRQSGLGNGSSIPAGKNEDLEHRILKLRDAFNQLKNELLNQEHKQKMQNLLVQNEIGRKKLQSIFGFNDESKPVELEGLLSDYVDENEDSLELVRSVRHPS